MVERTLTERQLNRALLARQLLLDRAELTIPRALERVGGLQTQYAPSGYIGLWSRLAGFRREQLTEALERRRVVQGTLMRATIHLVSRGDYPLFARAVQEARRAWWLRAARRQRDARTMAAVARRARSLLAEGPRTNREIVEHLGIDTTVFNGLGLWIDLLRVPPSGTWERRRADLYGLADDWLTSMDGGSQAEAIVHLVRRYLGGYGPASRKDIASWSGLQSTAIAPALSELRIRRFRDERGEELLDLLNAPLPDPETPVPVRFLPTWDATLLAHARRTQILPERHRSKVFAVKTPHSTPTFLVDGRVAGAWRYDRGRVRLDPFERLPAAARRELEDEAERLAAFHA